MSEPQFSRYAFPHDRDDRIWYSFESTDLAVAEHPEVKSVTWLRGVTPDFQNAVEAATADAILNPTTDLAGPPALQELGRQDSESFLGRNDAYISFRGGQPVGKPLSLHIDGSKETPRTVMRLVTIMVGEGMQFYAGALSHYDKWILHRNHYLTLAYAAKMQGVLENMPRFAVTAMKSRSRHTNDSDKLQLHTGVTTRNFRFGYVHDYAPGSYSFRTR